MTSKIFKNENDFSEFRVLLFNLKLEPFNVMVTAEKKIEFRDKGKYWDKRLTIQDGSPKIFDYVKFRHAYNSINPFFICKYEGLETVKNIHVKYSTGFEVNFNEEKWGIKLGEIVLIGNME